MSPPRIALGTSDFCQLRRDGRRYVDKSLLVAEVLRDSARVLLFPRPRRFGKTLNLSTLAAFLERSDDDRTDLFEGLAVWRAGDDVRAQFQRFPVIFLTFKDVKYATWPDAILALAHVIAAEVRRLAPLITPCLNDTELAMLDALGRGLAEPVALANSLRDLSAWLQRATGENVVILIDEYDTPIHAAFHHGYYDKAIELLRNLLSGAFKDNKHLHKGVLTGILRVAKESIFSGLNNLGVHGILSPEFATHFGFTQAEVAELAEEHGAAEHLPTIERWYNGYRFGGQTIYNPWSVLSFLASQDRAPRPYWIQTSSDDILRELLVQRGHIAAADLETLLRGGSVRRAIDEHIVLREVHQRADAVWAFLLFSGYLKAIATYRDEDGLQVDLQVPNVEVGGALRRLFAAFLDDGLLGSDRAAELGRALLAGDAVTFEAMLGELLLTTMSYHDVAGRRPEAVYQAFVAGLLVRLDATHVVSANREAGFGRVDVLVSPRQAGGVGVVLELKVVQRLTGETVEQALAAALRQLQERAYAAELQARGAGVVHQLGAVFDGKRAWVAAADHVRPSHT